MTTRIVRVGNTLTVEVPEELLAQASLPVGEPVEWVANGNGSIALVKFVFPNRNYWICCGSAVAC